MRPTKAFLLLALVPTLSLQTGCCSMGGCTTFGIAEVLIEDAMAAALDAAFDSGSPAPNPFGATADAKRATSGDDVAGKSDAIFARPDGPHSGLSVMGVVTVDVEIPLSALIYVSAFGVSALVDADGSYYLSTRVPQAACEGLEVTATLVNPPAPDITRKRSVGWCGDHEVDFRFD